MVKNFWLVLGWLIATLEFVLIIYILVNWVGKEPTTQVAETTQPSPTLQATTTATEERPTQDSKFKVGDQAVLSVNSNLRDKPGGELIQTLSKEETLELTEGPISAKSSWWWKAKVASTSAAKADQLLGLTGYIAEGYWLKKKP